MLQRTNEKRSFVKKYLSYYTIAFLILYGAMYVIFKASGKSFLWDCDGTTQHYPALYYMGDYFKNAVKGMLGMEAAPINMVDFRLGQGMDVLTTLNYYGFGDPLNLLSVFVSQENIEGLYTFLIALRLYLTGAAFSYYCFKIGRKEGWAVLLGAMTYTFSGMTLFAGVRHPFFLNAYWYLPLLLVAAERMLQKRKYGCFTGMVALSLISNFYFAYMNTAMVGIYLLLRIFGTKEGKLGEKLLLIGKMILAYLWGVLLSAVVFLPVVYAFLQNARTEAVGGYTDSLLFYDLSYYRRFIANYFTPRLWIGSWSIISMASIGLLALVMFVKGQKENEDAAIIRTLRRAYLVLVVFVLVPFFGKFLNGNGYVCNRWMYAFAMVNAMIVVVMAPRLLKLTREEVSSLWNITLGYSLLAVLCSGTVSIQVWIGVGCLCATMAVVDLLNKNGRYDRKSREWAMNGITIATIITYMVAVYAPFVGRYVNSFCGTGRAYQYQKNSSVQAMSEIKDDSFYRVEQNWLMSNQETVLGYHGNTFYWSIVPETVTKYYDELALSALDRTFECNSQDARAVLNELSSTKYYVTESTKAGLVPYGYEFVKQVEREDGIVDRVYENKYALPIGYGYDSYMKRSEYEKLAPLQKQEVLLSAAVIDDAAITEEVRALGKEVTASEVGAATEQIPVTIGELQGITMSGKTFEVTEKNATMELQFEGKKRSETYLVLRNFKVIEGEDYNKLTITSGSSVETTMFLYHPANAAYYDKEYQGVNIGYSDQEKNRLVIKFPSEGTFSFDSLEMYCYSMENYEEQATKLQATGMKHVKVSGNQVTGTVENDQATWMQFSIPYSKGWKAYVDGKEVSLSPSNTAYMGAFVESGNHEIKLVYETPYIRLGAMISLLAAGIGIVCVVVGRRKNKE